MAFRREAHTLAWSRTVHTNLEGESGRWAKDAGLSEHCWCRGGRPACRHAQVFFELLSEAGSILALVQLAKSEAAYGLTQLQNSLGDNGASVAKCHPELWASGVRKGRSLISGRSGLDMCG